MSLSVSHKNVDGAAGGDGQELSDHPELRSPATVSRPQPQIPSHKESRATARPPISAFQRWLCRRLLEALGDPPIRLVLWNEEEIATSDQAPVARVIIRDRPTLWRLIIDPLYQFGEAYSQKLLEVDGDLRAFLEVVYRARLRSGSAEGPLQRIWSRLLHAGRPNSVAAARENIHRHYDIGNDFYRLWLDAEMIYSCAYFARDDMTLADAQRAKLDYVCRKLWLKPGERVVDVGGGWGGAALFMARRYGVTVKAYNISHPQIEFARRRAHAEGLDGQVEFIEDDYRKISGQFDALVSLGMLEHVGKGHYREFGRMCDRCLAPHGRALIQTIAQSRSGETNPWIARRIFPGGHAPTLSEMTEIVEPYGFSVLDLENLRLHYAKTLEHWLARFESCAETVAKTFDEKFVRMWRLYLSGSWAAFASGAIQLYQFLFARPTLSAIPMTRAYLYAGDQGLDDWMSGIGHL
jgi:cyclopropane-fatty-acyl-phospholipid synthase